MAKRALIIANGRYDDERFTALPAAAADAIALKGVLSDPAIGEFTVEVARDLGQRASMRAIQWFFSAAEAEDLLLLHMSAHGWKDLRNQLYFIASDTERDLLEATAISADFVGERMRQSKSRRIVLLLDCCYSGAFTAGMRRRAGESPAVKVAEPFAGKGRVVMTASTALQFAHEREPGILLSQTTAQPSLFTAAIVQGLCDGSADLDQDGFISVGELYYYVHQQVGQKVPGQTPTLSVDSGQGTIYLARNPRVPDTGFLSGQRSTATDMRALAGWPLAEVTDPFALEVHHAIDVGASALPVLPVYVRRQHDARLDAVVRAAAQGRSGIAVLVGGSSTGKTRACWEALRRLRDQERGWRLWHPIDPARPTAALADLARIGPRTVIWLNETQHYLLTSDPAVGEAIAAGLRELLRTPRRGPVVILGTLWPRYWDFLTAVPEPGQPDFTAQSRELLEGVSIRVAEAFGGTDLEAAVRQAHEGDDPRLAEAVHRAPSGRLTQYLAGGPALIDRYDNAEPEARAILDAAIDARRLGHGKELLRQFLEDAASGYLSEEQRDLPAGDWEQAFAYLTDPRPCRGASAPLTLIRPQPGTSLASTGHEYQLADYLEQHSSQDRRRPTPPAGFYAAARHFKMALASMYCVKCRAKREVFAERVEMKNGKPALRARCPVCGTGMFKIGGH